MGFFDKFKKKDEPQEKLVPQDNALMQWIAQRNILSFLEEWRDATDEEKKRAMDFLHEWMKDPYTRSETREFIARIFGEKCEKGDEEAISSLVAGIKMDPNPPTKVALLFGLQQLEAKSTVDFLNLLIQTNNDQSVQQAAMQTLEYLKKDHGSDEGLPDFLE